MVRASQSGQQVSSSRVMRAKASMDPLSYRNTQGTNLFSAQEQERTRENIEPSRSMRKPQWHHFWHTHPRTRDTASSINLALASRSKTEYPLDLSLWHHYMCTCMSVWSARQWYSRCVSRARCWERFSPNMESKYPERHDNTIAWNCGRGRRRSREKQSSLQDLFHCKPLVDW